MHSINPNEEDVKQARDRKHLEIQHSYNSVSQEKNTLQQTEKHAQLYYY
jgi:hypothetical protein